MVIEKTVVKEEIAKNFTFYRKKNEMTQKELAFLLGVKDNTITQWEKGVNSIDVEILFKACDIFGISINDIYGKYALEKKVQYSKEEKELIESFRSINEKGKELISEYIDYLVTSGKYAKIEKENLQPHKIAAFGGEGETVLVSEKVLEEQATPLKAADALHRGIAKELLSNKVKEAENKRKKKG